jgi:hypothetical protein
MDTLNVSLRLTTRLRSTAQGEQLISNVTTTWSDSNGFILEQRQVSCQRWSTPARCTQWHAESRAIEPRNTVGWCLVMKREPGRELNTRDKREAVTLLGGI